MKFTKVIAVAVITVAAFVTTAVAQDPAPTATPRDKNEIYVGFEYERNNANLRVNNFKIKGDQDAPGLRMEYARKVTKVIAVGMKAGVTFENRDTDAIEPCGPNCIVDRNGISKIADAHFGYFVRLQVPKGKVRPYVEAIAGADRSNFGGMTFVNGRGVVGSKNSLNVGGGAGVDIGKGKVAFRIGLDYLNGAGQDGRRHILQLHAGPVFRF